MNLKIAIKLHQEERQQQVNKGRPGTHIDSIGTRSALERGKDTRSIVALFGLARAMQHKRCAGGHAV